MAPLQVVMAIEKEAKNGKGAASVIKKKDQDMKGEKKKDLIEELNVKENEIELVVNDIKRDSKFIVIIVYILRLAKKKKKELYRK